MSKELLFITTRLFWPTDSGRKVSLYHYCRGLSEQLGYEVHLYSFLEGDQDESLVSQKPGFIGSVTLAEPMGAKAKLANVARALPREDMPLQCALFCSKRNMTKIRETVKRLEPDVVMVDMIRLAPYLEAIKDLPCATVMDLDDLLSKRYFRQLGGTGGSAMGKYGFQLPSPILKFANARPVKDFILRTEARRTEKAERRYAMEYDATLFVSPIEARELNSAIKGNRCFTATLGAELTEKAGWVIKDKSYECAFVGNMFVAANQDSLRMIVDEVMPHLPDVKLRVIGVKPESYEKSFAENSAISFSGRVDSVQEELDKCEILLAPFAYGTGIKTKVLEAMGAGVPVVTNSLGVEGLDVTSGREVVVSDDSKALAADVRSLLADEELRLSIARAGREYVDKNHRWEDSVKNLGACLEFARESLLERSVKEGK